MPSRLFGHFSCTLFWLRTLLAILRINIPNHLAAIAEFVCNSDILLKIARIKRRRIQNNMESRGEQVRNKRLLRSKKIPVLRPSTWVYTFAPFVFGYQCFASKAQTLSSAFRCFYFKVRLKASKILDGKGHTCAFLWIYGDNRKALDSQPVITNIPHLSAYF